MRKYYIDTIDITKYVSSYYDITEKTNHAGDSLLSVENFNLELFNYEDIFNFKSDNSIFWSRDILESYFYIYEDEFLIYSGLVVNLEVDVSKNVCNIETVNILNKLLDRTLIYISDDFYTPADTIYQVLDTNFLIEHLDLHSWQYSKNIEIDNNFAIKINYNLESTTDILSVLRDIAGLSGASIFFNAGKIYYWHNSIIDNAELAVQEIESKYIIGNIKFYNDYENIKNQYSYTITVATIPISLSDVYIAPESRLKYGVRSYNNFDLTTGKNIEASAGSVIGLQDIGTEKINITKNPIQYLEFEYDWSRYNFPLYINQLFKFSSTIASIEPTLTNTVFQIISIQKSKYTVKIVAMLILS